MTSANPLRFMKRKVDAAFHRAYYGKKLRGTDEILAFMFVDVFGVEGKVSPFLQELALKSLMRDLMVNRLEQLNVFDDRDAEPDLFRDFEYQFTFREGRERVQCVLGDVDYRRGLALLQRKEANIIAAINARDDYGRVWSIIGPLLKTHPDWVWRDAVRYLEEHGGIPDDRAVVGTA